MSMTAEQHIRRFESLKRLRVDAEDGWRECAEVTYPERGVLIGQDLDQTDIHATAKSLRARTFDSTATDAVRLLSSAIQSGAFPASSRWIGLTVNNMDKNASAHKYLDNAAEILWKNIHASNFDAVMNEATLDLVIFGMYGVYITDGEENSGKALHFELWPLHSLFCADSTGKGFIDTVYRPFTLTAEQAISEYGDEVGDNIKKAALKDPDKVFKFVQGIYPRKDEDKSGDGKLDMDVESVHVQCEGHRIVRESGYEEMPVIVPRWLGVPGSEYAVGQMASALPDTKTLNKAIEFGFGELEMSQSGMYGVVDDGVINPKTIKIGPRKVIVMANKDNFFPITSGGKPDFGMFEVDRLQGSIRKVLLADQLQPQDGPAMTATETHIRTQLNRQVLSPVYGRFKTETEPKWNRCFNLLYRRGAFGPLPEELEDKAIIPTYSSPLAKAQKLDNVGAMERFEAGLLQNAGAGITDPLDTYDFDKAARDKADLLDVPADLMRDDTEVKKVRTNRREAEAAALEAERKFELMKGTLPRVAGEAVKSGDMENMGDVEAMAG